MILFLFLFTPPMSLIPASENLTISFCDPAYLASHPLSLSTLLDYFQLSPFFIPGAVLDRTSASQGVYAHAAAEVCYACRPTSREEEAAGIFTIERRERGVITGVYLCLHGTIIMAPPLRELIIARAGRASVHLTNALNTLREIGEVQGASQQQGQ